MSAKGNFRRHCVASNINPLSRLYSEGFSENQFHSFRPPPQPSITASLEQRDFVIRELIETEANYLDVLQALKNKFMQPMEKLLKDEIKIIFPRIKVKSDVNDRVAATKFNFPIYFFQELVDIHKSFLEKLREATRPHSKLKLSSIFIEFREKFLVYGDYCNQMTDATDTLRDVCKRSVAVEQLVEVSCV